MNTQTSPIERLKTNICRLQALSDAVGTLGEAQQAGGCLVQSGTLQTIGMMMDEMLASVEKDVEALVKKGRPQAVA